MIPAGRKADLSGGERRETPMSKIHSVPGLFGGENIRLYRDPFAPDPGDAEGPDGPDWD